MKTGVLTAILFFMLLAACAPQRTTTEGQADLPLPSESFDNAPRDIPQPSERGERPSAAPEIQLTNISLHEDFVISDYERVINRTRFYLKGNLIVNGTGKLKIIDSEVIFVQDYNQQFRVYFRDNAVIEFDNVHFDTQYKWFNFDYKGNVSVKMINTRGNDCCNPWHGASENVQFDITNSTVGLTINNNVTVKVRDKSRMFFELVLSDVKGTFTLPQGYVNSFTLDIENNLRDRMEIYVEDSSFHHWGTTLDKHTDITFVDTSITIGMNAGSDWQLPSPIVKVSGLKAKRYEDYLVQFDTNNLRLLNTEITSWYPQAWNGATIELSDSDLADLQNNGRDSKLVVRNSKVDIAIARENVEQRYYDSEIRQDVIAHDDANIYLYNTKVGGRILNYGNGKIFIDGNLYEQTK